MVFKDRVEAGKKLAEELSRYKGEDVVVCALPRGGVVVGAEVARYLGAPLDLIISRKIGHPMSLEYAIGAVTETGKPVWNESELGFTNEHWRERQIKLARDEARRRRIDYKGDQPSVDVAGKIVLLVDDGIATGLTMVAAIHDLRKRNPKSIIVAVPVAPAHLHSDLVDSADDIVALHVPSSFGAVGTFYEEFDETTDEEVRLLMDAYRNAPLGEPLDLTALNAMIATIDHYPVTTEKLVKQSKRLHVPSNVVTFFESIPYDKEFHNKAEILKLSSEMEVLMDEEKDQPDEHLRSYD